MKLFHQLALLFSAIALIITLSVLYAFDAGLKRGLQKKSKEVNTYQIKSSFSSGCIIGLVRALPHVDWSADNYETIVEYCEFESKKYLEKQGI